MEQKPFWQSRTLIGGVLIWLIPDLRTNGILGLFTPQAQPWVDFALKVALDAGAALLIAGRALANKQLK